MGVLDSGELSDQCENVQALLYVIRIQLAGSWAHLNLQGLGIRTHTPILCARSVCGAEISLRKHLGGGRRSIGLSSGVSSGCAFLRHNTPRVPLQKPCIFGVRLGGSTVTSVLGTLDQASSSPLET
jgi:hypothetical protein